MRVQRLANRLTQAKLIDHWRKHQNIPPIGAVDPNLIVSLTSFPARIQTTWIAIESIIRQSVRPKKITLVLNHSEFRSCRDLPIELENQKQHGLEIIWIQEDLRSYGKLIPTRSKYSAAKIVTIDDDIIYSEHMLAELIQAHEARPQQIVGCRGYEIQSDGDDNLLAYTKWKPANAATASNTCFLTGVGGILYPADSLPWGLACNRDLFESLCPTADDIWFWAMSLIKGSQRQCLGSHNLQEIKRWIKTPRLSRNNVSRGGNDRQLQQVVNYFQLSGDNRSLFKQQLGGLSGE